ncbi:FG-GAP-like repeat-containing protein [Streptomyces sp. Tu 3180]|uniref:FG-GAP-like repeat-containing protein n=1 Tax=Streptomyces sp. Tu 3180 TaxID=2682611 RepID=UPI001359A181|nr:FG-GAP-like repeat-containing protein [Streptomyces sp. Tu 3180]KAF3465368.1 VCBS repeat-containing protein [Streptomyces sp. Tu 3180]
MAARFPRRTAPSRPVRIALAAGVVLVAGALAAPGASAAPAQAPAAGTARPHDDFNGDGYADLAVAAPTATVGGKRGAGYVAVLYGSENGLRTATRQVFSQNTAGVPGSAETDDEFGSALATADLDRDGYADLVVGVAREDTADGGADSGLVEVVWGGPRGLSGGAALASGGNAHEGLGAHGHLTAGDVDGDGDPDVVTVENLHDLRVLRGPFGRDGAGAGGEQTVRDDFDSRVLDLAAGDVNGDGVTDVAATENDGDEYDARRIVYWQGTRDGLTPYRLVDEADGTRLQGGENLDVGDVNADGYDDIVVGRAVDGYDSDLDNPRVKGGRVTWIPGAPQGPDGARAVHLNQDSPGVPGTAEDGDAFGTGVRIGDVDGDGHPDVVTGLPGEDLGRVSGAGSVVVLRGTADGLTGAGARAVTQDTADVPGTAEKDDRFGRAAYLGDANGDGRADLAVGAPGENAGAGSVWCLRSSATTVVSPGGTTVFGAGTLGTVAQDAGLGTAFAR